MRIGMIEAEDLTLEAFWRLWPARGVADGRTGAWLYRVATRWGYSARDRLWVMRFVHDRPVGGILGLISQA